MKNSRATLALALMLIALWVATELAGGSTNLEVLRKFGMRRPLWGFSEDPLRLLSSMLLHYGVLHLVSNLVSLAVLGSALERLAGPASVLYVFFFSGLAGGLASMRWAPQSGSLGASGGIFGLAGALLILTWRYPEHSTRWRTLTTGVLLALLYLLGTQGQMGDYYLDRWGHLGGLGGGLLASLALRPRLDWRPALALGSILGGLIYVETHRGPRLF